MAPPKRTNMDSFDFFHELRDEEARSSSPPALPEPRAISPPVRTPSFRGGHNPDSPRWQPIETVEHDVSEIEEVHVPSTSPISRQRSPSPPNPAPPPAPAPETEYEKRCRALQKHVAKVVRPEADEMLPGFCDRQIPIYVRHRDEGCKNDQWCIKSKWEKGVWITCKACGQMKWMQKEESSGIGTGEFFAAVEDRVTKGEEDQPLVYPKFLEYMFFSVANFDDSFYE